MGLRPVHGEFGLKIHQVHSLRLGILKIMGLEPSKARSKSTTPHYISGSLRHQRALPIPKHKVNVIISQRYVEHEAVVVRSTLQAYNRHLMLAIKGF